MALLFLNQFLRTLVSHKKVNHFLNIESILTTLQSRKSLAGRNN